MVPEFHRAITWRRRRRSGILPPPLRPPAMLHTIHIRNLALLEHAEIRLAEGLTVISVRPAVASPC